MNRLILACSLLLGCWQPGFSADRVANGTGLDQTWLALAPLRMQEFVDQHEISGAVTLIARHGKVAQLEAVGWQDIESKKPMRTDSIFQIMSMTKPLTGVGIMMLAEDGKLTLNDPVELILPEFKGQRLWDGKRPAHAITIRDLMTHTSGMSSRLPEPLKNLYTKMDRTLADAVGIYAQQPLEFEPGSKWAYSNTGLATLGRIIEVKSGQPYDKYIQDRLLSPLGMKDSFFFPPADKTARIVTVYTGGGGGLTPAGAGILGGDSLAYRKGAIYSAPEFGLFSTANDLAAFYQMMLNGGTYQGRRYLSKASIEAMTALQTGDLQAGHNPGCGFGLTWEVVKDQTGTLALLSEGTYKHGGAFGTHGWVDPKKDVVGVFLIQRSDDNKRVRDAFMQIVGSSLIE